MDYKDLDKKRFSLKESIKNAMDRELTEENSILKSAKISESKVLGFFRWVRRSGKPEFVGITKLDNRVDELTANYQEVDTKLTYYFKDINDFANIIDEILNFTDTSKKNPRILSVPLKMNLLILKEYFVNNKEGLKQFIFP